MLPEEYAVFSPFACKKVKLPASLLVEIYAFVVHRIIHTPHFAFFFNTSIAGILIMADPFEVGENASHHSSCSTVIKIISNGSS
ncbi:MAG: hypothetical protein QXO03_04800 [Thermoplasmatales archaeon]